MENFFIIFSFLLCVPFVYQEVTELKQVPPRSYLYLAFIGSKIMWCHGVLITENYVLTNARCVAGYTKSSIYLGWYNYPQDKYPADNPDIQIYSTNATILHPDFRFYENDIALLKLSQAVSVTRGVKPVRLADPNTFGNKNLTDQYGQIFGWWTVGNLSAATVQIRSPDYCKDIFGQSYLIDRHLCVKWPKGKRFCSYYILPMEINGTLIGLQQADLQNHGDCKQFEYKFNNIVFYYDWILANSDLGEYIKTSQTDNATENTSDVSKTTVDTISSTTFKENSCGKTRSREELKEQKVLRNNAETRVAKLILNWHAKLIKKVNVLEYLFSFWAGLK